MGKDYSKEVIEIIKNYKKEDIECGKPLNFLVNRINMGQELIEEEILNCKNLAFTERQEKANEVRYALFFIHSKKQGRKYIITFRQDKLRIITIFSIGKRTLRRYRKKGLNI